MRIILIVILSVFTCPTIKSMDTPAKSLPHAVEAQRQKEVKRLKSYNLDRPEKFLESMRKELNSTNNLLDYLKKLQIFASGLLYQHILMDLTSKVSYLKDLFAKSKEHYDLLLHRLKGKYEGNQVVIIPQNDVQLNILLAHMDLIEEAHELSPEEITIIFSWILDSEKGAWLNTLGRQLKTLHESFLIKNQLDPILTKKSDLIFAIPKTPILAATEKIIDRNLDYLYSTSKNLFTYLKLKEDKSNDEEKLTKDYKRNDANISNLYRSIQSWYQKMYVLVRAELYQVFKQLVEAKEENIKQYILPVAISEQEKKNLPSAFPAELQTIPEPETIISIPSLDVQLEQARVAWEKAHAQAPAPKKKIKRKRRTQFVSFANTPEGTPSEEEPEETAPIVKKEDDGSYIEQGAEDDLKIIIEDPLHDTTATIFKTKSSPENSAKLKSLPKINYTRWVNEWFENPEKARSDQGYTDPKNPRYRAGEPPWKATALHAFPKLVDDYILKYGRVSKTPSRRIEAKDDIMVTIPGKMDYHDENEETGIFTYIIDPENGQWFHRMFTPSSHKEMAADFMKKGYFAPEIKGYYDVYFPPLSGKK